MKEDHEAGRIEARPFHVAVPQEALDDLARRLGRARLPEPPKGEPWRYGTARLYMDEVLAHWREKFDWRAWEARINAFPGYMAEVDGQSIHFLMEKGSGIAPRPLLLTHGWPGSILEFLEVIEKLAHPERFGGDESDAFTVIVPALPGYGFSPAPPGPMGAREIARLWHALMTRNLGFESFLAQGGDWGSAVTAWLAFDFPQSVRAIHLNFAIVAAAPGEGPPFDEEEKAWAAAYQATRDITGAYRAIQGTKPLTLAYALTDSPVGLAAWILEKFHGWTFPGEQGPPPFDLDLLLANVMLYWLPGPIASSWIYATVMDGSGRLLPPGGRIGTPTRFLLCPRDLMPPPPRRFLERAYNVADYEVAQTGGHFLALEQPELFVEDVRAFFRAWR